MCSHSLLFDSAPVALKVHIQVLPELFVSDTVDDWAQEPWQDVDNQVVGISDF